MIDTFSAHFFSPFSAHEPGGILFEELPHLK
jgi:hypothetical protein